MEVAALSVTLSSTYLLCMQYRNRPSYYIMTPSTDHDDQNLGNNDQNSEGRNLLILYATETGTAQDAADRIARECRRIHFNCRVLSMHAYPLVSLTLSPYSYRIDVILTYIPVWTDFRKPSYIYCFDNRFGHRAPFDDSAMAATSALRSTPRFIRRYWVCKLWTRRYVLWEILLAQQITF